MGSMFFYAGLSKIINPAWSAEGYIKGAKMFPGIYGLFLKDGILPIVNLLNEWGLLLIGVSLILGVWVKLSALCGVVLMLLYYFAILDFPYPNAHAYIVDEHIVYIAALLVLASTHAGRFWGLASKFG